MYSIVIVDDESDTRNGLANYYPWSNIGFMVKAVFDNGKSAYDYLLVNDADVVLSDIAMPIMTGLQLAEKLRAACFAGKIVFLSIHRDFEFARKGMSLGVKYYITKPTNFDEITDVFSKLKAEIDYESTQAIVPKVTLLDTENTLMHDIKRYIDLNYRTTSLYDVASYFCMNSSYFSKFFKLHTKINFSEYLLKLRMETAARYLTETRYKIHEISELIGYGTSQSFMRVFKAYYGATPNHYRNDFSLARGQTGCDFDV